MSQIRRELVKLRPTAIAKAAPCLLGGHHRVEVKMRVKASAGLAGVEPGADRECHAVLLAKGQRST